MGQHHKTARPLKVAVVGSGLAGLTAAHVLVREASRTGEDVEVHLFEKAPSLGFSSSSIVVPVVSSTKDDRRPPLADDDDGILANGAPIKPWIVDVPMRSFQGGYYPHLLSLYQSVFIPIQPKAFTYSFSHLLPTSTATYFTFEGSSGAARPSLPSTVPIFTALSRLLVFAFSYAYLLLLALSYRLIGWPGGTVSQWTTNVGRRVWGGWVGSRWEEFVQEIIIVLFGAVGTCTDQDTGDLHIGLVLDYIFLTLFTSHYTVPTSSSSVSRALSACLPQSHIHLSSTILSLRRDAASSTTSITFSQDGSIAPSTLDGFDEVILATQANQAARLLSTLDGDDLSATTRQNVSKVSAALRTFRYVKTIVINHTDSSLLPSPSADIREINLLRCPHPSAINTPTPSAGANDKDRLDYFPPAPGCTFTQATHILLPPPSHAKTHGPVYQTTNPIVPIPKEKILSVAHLERALPTAISTSLLPRLLPSHPSTLQGVEGIWLVGAYAWKGIPLLEGCVRSSEEVVMGEGGILDRWRGGKGEEGAVRVGKRGWVEGRG